MSQRGEPIAIIGTGCRFPGNLDTPSKLWDLLQDPRDLLSKVPADRFNAEAFYHPDPAHHGTTDVQESYFLSEDPSRFDTQFFGIQPMESDSIDPQQRMLLETVYESLSAAGLTIEGLRGSSTAVYVGLMCDDWSGILVRDWDAFPTYTATGMARSIISNRISYFFDWHGPSMTIDTACSSSLVAVHQAIQTLRSGESRVAVAAGANLILSPGMYIAESKLHMLSPTGRSRMWDKDANGYARGEGLASVVLKTLSAALQDGDHIECIIRETGLNQDGRTPGITMPSNSAQTALIRDTYAKAGLDITKVHDRPQFFHAHGTGTPAGDPQEAEAVNRAFFPHGSSNDKTLYVGSIKTIIGHTEGTAGLASLIGTSLAIQHKIIPPNMHFDHLSDKVAPFYHNLEVPTKAESWPEVSNGQPRRASVNSFGFGGSNAHAILESYDIAEKRLATLPLFTPMTFSAVSERALQATLVSYSKFLKENKHTNIRDLAWTLQSRRSVLAFKTTVSGTTTNDLHLKIDFELAQSEERGTALGVRLLTTNAPRILGVFTGQGAQWPTMGRDLISNSLHVRNIIAALDRSLAGLPINDRPSWSIQTELMADVSSSRLADAALSQPLCTAVQIVLVDLIRSAGIQFHAVVGHSSGEIGAAYAAGYISASDAIQIAYYRGFHANLARSPNGKKGSMLAVGTSFEDALTFCGLEAFQGRLMAAASNSSASVTLSGDDDAIEEAIQLFKDEQKFVRKLNVDTAYHSLHMEPCSKPYLQSLSRCKVKIEEAGTIAWFSSVIPGQRMTKDLLSDQYWMDNMINPVMFSDAIATAISESGPFDIALEIGPHPALKGPCMTNIEEASGVASTPYSGLLLRGANDINAFSAALGFLWRFLGQSVDFDTYERLVSGNMERPNVVVDLPLYPWDHQRAYWTESRLSGGYKARKEAPHPLLGAKCIESSTPEEIQWRNLLRPTEVSWLKGHKLQGQTVFPASGYIVMAIEAMQILVGKHKIKLIEVEDLTIGRAITFNDDSSGVETLFSCKLDAPVYDTSESVIADFKCYSCLQNENSLSMNACGRVLFDLGDASETLLPALQTRCINMVDVDIDRFYSSLTKLGYNYSDRFRGITLLTRRIDQAAGSLVCAQSTDWEDNLTIHPGMLDTALQTIFAAHCSPGDNRLWSLHVPTHIQRVRINPFHCVNGYQKQAVLPFQSIVTSDPTASLRADVDVFSEDGQQAFVQIQGVSLVPFSRALPENDACIFSKFVWKAANLNGKLAAMNERPTAYEKTMACDLERVSFYYLKHLAETITSEERSQTLLHYQRLLAWADHVLGMVSSGQHPFVKPENRADTHAQILEIIDRYRERVDVRLIEVVGENLPAVIRNRSNILEYMTQDGLLSNFYEEGMGLLASNRWIGRLAKQLAHRYPHMNIFEIGAGTGGATRAILGELGSAFSSYTYTDISSAFFEEAQGRFKDFAGRMIFKTFDMEKSIEAQGYVEGSYDLIIASNVLHATNLLEQTMQNTRRLLKPGGFLLLLEVVNNEPLRNGLPMGGLPGWWIGADSGRPWGPTLSLSQWDSLLRKTGFSGVDTNTPDYDELHPFSVFASQALDDRVKFLRKPLSALPAIAVPKVENLIIIGGTTLQTIRLVEDMVDLLAQSFQSIARIDSIEDLERTIIPTTSSILSVTELDEPTLVSISTNKLVSLKKLFSEARNILWVTRGCRADVPHSNMMVGLGRGLRFEYPNINLQMLDVDKVTHGTSEIIAGSLIRLQTIDAWKREKPLDDLLWSTEPEVAVEQGLPMIPRLLTNQVQNDRYNSTRRVITRDVILQSSRVKIAYLGSSHELRESSCVQSLLCSNPTGSTRVRVSHSLLQSIRIESAGYFFLCLGSVLETGEPVLALSSMNESVVDIPPGLTISYGISADPLSILLSIAGGLVSHSIVSMTPTDGTLLVYEPTAFIVPTLVRQAAAQNIKLYFATSKVLSTGSDWIYIHPSFTERSIKKALPNNISLFVDLSVGRSQNGIGKHVAECLPYHCKTESAASLFGDELITRPDSSFIRIANLLETVWGNSRASDFDIAGERRATVVNLADLPLHTGLSEPFSIVNWTASPIVPVKIQPVDSEDLFRPDRTYLLVGLSGEVGQSLCQWMVGHGARYVVLTSRSPMVSKDWIESQEATGATIKVLPLDITSRESLHACHDEICRTLPPIAGVANGAMILRDKLFHNMDIDTMLDVLKPKVDGSIHLNELFLEDTLDFFILFSSITSVVGNSGQSNYIMANMFMTSLAFQRKKRGLAGSVIDISSLIGIGYVERSDTFDAEYFSKIGYTNISEQDLHQLFAEAILAGRPGSLESAEIVTGFAPAFADAEIKAPYRSDLKFCHYIIERTGTQQYTNQEAVIPVRIQLASAKTKEELYGILRTSLTNRLRQILQIPGEDEVSESMALVEHGVDSLVAVEVRSWLIKELDVDMPVLKILGGASIADLLEYAIGKLPAIFVPNVVPTDELDLVLASTETEVERRRDESSPLLGTPSSGYTSSPASELQTEESMNSQSSDSEVSSNAPIAKSPPETTEQMSFGQSRFWFLNHFLRDQTTFNMAFSVRLEGNLRFDDLERALHAVVQKHEALRTRFFSLGTHMEQPMQGIIDVPWVSLRRKSITSESQITHELESMRAHIWNLEKWETMRVTLLSLSSTNHCLIVGCHHIAMDGVSFQIFFADLEKAYLLKTLSPCATDSQYRAFSALQHLEYENGSMDADLDFYRRLIPDKPKPLPLFPFARRSSRKILDNYGSHRADYRMDPVLTTRIKDLCKKHKSTTFHFFLAALQCLIFRFMEDTDDFFIGIADANRNDSKFLGTLGFFLNLLPLRFQRRSRQTFIEALRDARKKAFAALGHSKLPFDVLLNRLNITRSAMHTPLFQVFVDYRQGVQERTTFADFKATGESWHIAKTGYDMSLDIIENTAGDSLLTLKLQESLYSRSDTEMILQTYVNLLKSFSMDPHVSIETPSLWRKIDIDTAIELGRGRTMQLRWPPTLSHRVDMMVQQHPVATALKDGTGNTLTYSEMAGRVNAISTTLMAANATDGARVAVFQEPTSDWICSLLAIFRTGAVYVPLDLRTPLSRLGAIVQICQPTTILVDRATLNKASSLGAASATIIDISTISQYSSQTMTSRAGSSSPAVILFTSGSTGTPKGIVINHSSLRNQMESYSREWDIGAGIAMTLQQSAFSFDFSIDQIFSALSNGGALYIVPATQRGDPAQITKLMATQGITYTSATPSEYLMWTRYGASDLKLCSKWKYAFAGGEPLPEALVEDIQKLSLPGLRFFNNYGPAEITVASTKIEIFYNEFTPGESIPAGFMLPNYSVYIVDKDLNPLPVGMPGEIVIGGSGVSSGYIDNQDLTNQKFIPDLFIASDPSYIRNGWRTMYRTGDRGRLRGDGALMCEGRIDGDTQVKLRGLRIELEDIENTIIQVSNGTLLNAVLSVRGPADSQYLVAHVVFAQFFPEEDREAYLKRLPGRLPLAQYMCPALILVLDSLPLTNHFKIDRLAINALSLPTNNEYTDLAGLTETELLLRLVWREIIPHAPAIVADSDFFHVGGNSLLLVKLQAIVRETFDRNVRLIDLMDASTLGLMASVIRNMAPIHNIDWAAETALQEFLVPEHKVLDLSTKIPGPPSDNLVVLLTGSTGYLGGHILPRLVADMRISKVYCVTIRDEKISFQIETPSLSEKVILRTGDLALPSLGLSNEEFIELSGKVSVIIHAGANRSFWDNYGDLRASNVSPVKELVKLALPHNIPIHFVSSGGVLQYSSTEPPADGTNGYVASKWAAEQYLSNAAKELGLPVYIHRPLSTTGITKPAPPEVLNELLSLAKQMATYPSFDKLDGHIDLLPTITIVEDICATLFEKSPSHYPRLVSHESCIRLSIASFVNMLENDMDIQGYKSIPALQWVGAAKKLGFSYFIASQDITMGTLDGNTTGGLVSKR